MLQEVIDMVSAGSKESLLLKNYSEHVADRTCHMRIDMLELADKLADSKIDDMSGSGLQTRVLNLVDCELVNLANFDAERKAPGAAWLPFQISTHKLNYILPKVRAYFAAEDGDSNVVKIATGVFKPDESFNALWPMLRTDTFFGSNKATIETAKMFCVRFATSEDTIADYSTSSIAHVTPYKHIPESFSNSGSKFAANINGTPGFGFMHGGYAFGGQRDEPNQQIFGPEDCSSLLANILHQTYYPGVNQLYSPAPKQYSTMHQLFAWRARQKDANMFIDRNKDMYDSAAEQYWDTMLEATNPDAAGIKAGDIYLLRTFAKNKGNPDLHATGGGHTGVVIGRDPSDATKVLIFECARDMELEDPAKNVWGVAGAGIGSFSVLYNEETDDRIKRNMFLRARIR